MKLYGLIGRKLGHSFSQKYFRQKFKQEEIRDHDYLIFELDSIAELPNLIQDRREIKGFNVTIPYKEDVLPYLNETSDLAKEIGAVNTVKVRNDGKLYGYNTDYYGFSESIVRFIPIKEIQALVLGSGGSSKAIQKALTDLKVPFKIVSRSENKGHYTYEQIKRDASIFKNRQLIINCTPLGMAPQNDLLPPLNYQFISSGHYLFDLIYNPSETYFLKKGKEKGARIKNGMEMLILQAEKSWDIWNASED